ncbi:MAG: AAA family ATPase [Nitrospinae bacterium]|nr:AAA family ATPase [Nitrospinota bacterium]MBF0633376.1 AAA family ATPase [Nitrospinota bacterium]
MPLKIIQPDSVERFTALVIGAAGIGKTSLLRTIPADEKVCVLSAEGGLLCVRDLVQAGHIEGFEIGTFTEFKEAFDFLAHDNQARERYRWIFIDSLTEIAGRCVEAYQAKYPDKKDSFNLWGGYRDSMTVLIKGFRDLAPYNVVFTCLEEKDKDDINRIYYMPALAGKEVKERLTSYFDEVFYMTTLESGGTVERVFFTQPYERRPAKDRSGRLDLVEKPDLQVIKQKIFNWR